MPTKLRIGYVPEHFSTPIHFAYSHFGLSSIATLHPVPSGTGHMIEQLRSNDLDICIGLTEGFVAGLAKQKSAPFPGGPVKIIGTYVQSPLCWAISTGAQRSDITDVASLRGTRVGVSRLGSGSHIMSSVLAQQQHWLPSVSTSSSSTATTSSASPTPPPLQITPIGPFAPLRAAVSGSSAADAAADFFMWEHFTTKKFWESGQLKRVGEIYTPWPSWVIAARTVALGEGDARTAHREVLRAVLEALDKGVEYFWGHREEALGFITGSMEYSRADAEAWMGGVRFAEGVAAVDAGMVKGVVDVLAQVGVLEGGVEVEDVVDVV